MTHLELSRSGEASPTITPPKSSRPHLIGALVGAVVALLAPRRDEVEALTSGFELTPWRPFGPLIRPATAPLDASAFAGILWQAVNKVLRLPDDVRQPPFDKNQLESWMESFRNKIWAFRQEEAFLSIIPVAIASLSFDDEAMAALRRSAISTEMSVFNSKWSVPSMWLYLVLLRAAMLRQDPVKAVMAEVSSMPDGLRDGFQAILGRGWSPSWDACIFDMGMHCLAHIMWVLRSGVEPAVAFRIAFASDSEDRNLLHLARVLTGAAIGAVHGIHRIPSNLTSAIRNVDGLTSQAVSRQRERVIVTGLWDLQNIALQLAGLPIPKEARPEPSVGPVMVGQNLYAANLLGALGVPHSWSVISLCRVGESFDFHSHHRQIYLIDQEGDINPDLAAVVQDAVDAIDIALSKGQPVVVHCHGGRSRTGLILKAWKMRRDGVDEQVAHEWLKAVWPLVHRSNQTFRAFLENEWPKVMKKFDDEGVIES